MKTNFLKKTPIFVVLLLLRLAAGTCKAVDIDVCGQTPCRTDGWTRPGNPNRWLRERRKGIAVSISESRDGTVIRTESTGSKNVNTKKQPINL